MGVVIGSTPSLIERRGADFRLTNVKADVRSTSCKKEGRTLRGVSHIAFFLAMDCYDGDQRYFFNSVHSISIRIKVKIFCLIRA